MTALYFTPGIAPGDVLDFSFWWNEPVGPGNPLGPWLATGETIATASVSASPAGLTISTPLVTGDTVTVWVSNATAATSYTLTCEITTSEGRTANRGAVLNCTGL